MSPRAATRRKPERPPIGDPSRWTCRPGQAALDDEALAPLVELIFERLQRRNRENEWHHREEE